MSRFDSEQCEHARVWAALAPDGELSELERRSLRSHLHTCPACTRFALDVENVALLLGSAEPERPAYPVTLPRIVRRRHAFATRSRPVVAAAAVALMAIGIASRAPLQMDGRDNGTQTTTAASDSQQAEIETLRKLRHVALTTAAADRSQLEPMALMANVPA
jgi:predicted anti-sigma-YlaC factor YlaD